MGLKKKKTQMNANERKLPRIKATSPARLVSFHYLIPDIFLCSEAQAHKQNICGHLRSFVLFAFSFSLNSKITGLN